MERMYAEMPQWRGLQGAGNIGGAFEQTPTLKHC